MTKYNFDYRKFDKEQQQEQQQQQSYSKDITHRISRSIRHRLQKS